MTRVLLITDVSWVRNDVRAALTEPDFELVESDDPTTVVDTIAANDVDAAVVDLQVMSMGGMAVVREIRDGLLLQGAEPIPVVLLLDRAADEFLARRAGATGWVIKPFEAGRLREVLQGALAPAARD